jgi:hypothetical protein
VAVMLQVETDNNEPAVFTDGLKVELWEYPA